MRSTSDTTPARVATVASPASRRWLGGALLAATLAAAPACNVTSGPGPVASVPAPAPTTAAPPPPATEAPTTAAPAPTPAAPAPTAPPTTALPLPVRWAAHRRTATCLDHAPASVEDYRRVFASRSVWSGGDGAHSVPLGDGRVLWMFGDTFVDGLQANGQPGPMLRNTLMVQDGRCFTLVTGKEGADWREPLPAAAAGEWLWPTGGVVDRSGVTPVVRVTAMRVSPAAGAEGWDWQLRGVDIVTLRLPDLGVVSTEHAPVAQDGAVKWGGGTLAAPGGQVYVYGWRQDHQIVARSTAADLGRRPWELWTGSGWSTDREAAVQPTIEAAPAAEFWVIPHGGGYLASAKSAEMNSHDVTTWWGPSPVGPFRRVGTAATTAGEGSPWITYFGKVTELPGVGLVTVWSQNYRVTHWPMDARPYGPQFSPPLPGSIP